MKRSEINQISRGGGNLIIELYNSDEKEQFSDQSFQVKIDGVNQIVLPGGVIIFDNGQG